MPTSALQREIKKKNPFDLPAEEAYLNLLRTACVLGAEVAVLFKRHGTSETKYNVLRILRGAGQPLPSLEVASRLITRVPDVTRLVDRLEREGHVERRRCDKDRRVVYVQITAKGLALLAKLDAPVRALLVDQFHHMTREELGALNALLEKARKASGESGD